MSFTLPNLPYDFDALEPFIDTETMKIHYEKHHQTYVNKLNATLENHQALFAKSVEDLISDPDSIPEAIRTAVINHGGGHANHSFFWQLLKKDISINGAISEEINRAFGNLDTFKEKFSQAATSVFGSGWAWLVMDSEKLSIMTTTNQDSPLSSGKKPIICLDVWEHAYYLKYQNRRPDYIEAFFNIINWEQVNKNLSATK
ncbi:MAG: superoxide dismutase [Patescibacteria group bacterium]|nr:superoxide dismutase [Patescibacteria group bacterium]